MIIMIMDFEIQRPLQVRIFFDLRLNCLVFVLFYLIFIRTLLIVPFKQAKEIQKQVKINADKIEGRFGVKKKKTCMVFNPFHVYLKTRYTCSSSCFQSGFFCADIHASFRIGFARVFRVGHRQLPPVSSYSGKIQVCTRPV